ncbi:hypothetical protein D3C87_2051500 [compost metagenome]
MGEDKPSWLLEVQKTLFILQDQVIGIDVVGIDSARSHDRVLHPAGLLVDREVAVVRLRRIDSGEVLAVLLVING